MDLSNYAISGLTGEATEAQPKCEYCGCGLDKAPNNHGVHDACRELADEFMHDSAAEHE